MNAQKTVTLTFTKSIGFQGKRFQVGDQMTGTILKAYVRPDLVECFVFVSNGVIYAGISYRSVTIS